MHKLSLLLLALFFVFSISSCSPAVPLPSKPDTSPSVSQTPRSTPTPTPTLSHNDLEISRQYLESKGVRLEALDNKAPVTAAILFRMLLQTYEALGGPVDTSVSNPDSTEDETTRKLRLLGIDLSPCIDSAGADAPCLTCSYVAGRLLELMNAVQGRLYWRADDRATADDILRRINLVISFYSSCKAFPWEPYKTQDLLGEDTGVSPLMITRLDEAKMMVTAYEKLGLIIPAQEANRPPDTDDMYAWKANRFFIWQYTDTFGPGVTGHWSDPGFLCANNFEWRLREGLGMEDTKACYGGLISALATLMKGFDGVAAQRAKETIIINGRANDWHVYQLKSGKYSSKNCVPSCVEMALRYQRITHAPSAERLRAKYPLEGEGWSDVLAENVMKRYSLKFTYSRDLSQEAMVAALDAGNILFVMYREPDLPEGHAVIIRGYWRLGDNLKFIIADPSQNDIGTFGYIEREYDAEGLIRFMKNDVNRYFNISPERP